MDFLNTEFFFKKLFGLLVDGDVWGVWQTLLAPVYGFLDLIRPYTLSLSLLLLVGIIYNHIRAHQIEHEEAARLGIISHHGHGHGEEEDEEGEEEPGLVGVPNEKWNRVVSHINSNNPSDWRLAILEADIMLDQMLNGMGYHGDSVGEKLKQIEKSDFTNLDKAWEAHKIRNSIAHAGADFLLNEREAKRVVSLYEDVFKEFHFV